MTPRLRQLTPTEADIRALIDLNPLAGEQLKVIILNRLLEEAELRLTQQPVGTVSNSDRGRESHSEAHNAIS